MCKYTYTFRALSFFPCFISLALLTAYLVETSKLERAHVGWGAHRVLRRGRSRRPGRVEEIVDFLRRAAAQVVERALAVVDLDLGIGENLRVVTHLALDFGLVLHGAGDVRADHGDGHTEGEGEGGEGETHTHRDPKTDHHRERERERGVADRAPGPAFFVPGFLMSSVNCHRMI